MKYSGDDAIDVWKGRIKGIKMEIEKNQKKQEEWQQKYERQTKKYQTESKEL